MTESNKDCAAYYSDEPSPHDQFTELQQILLQKAASIIKRQVAELMEAKELIRQILDDRLDNDADIGEWKEKASKLLAYENKKG